jgi:hypothetical protein
MICTRYLPAVTALLALACVPTVVHSYLGTPAGDGRTLTAVPMRLNGLEGRPSPRSPEWVQNTYGTADFIERQYGSELTLFMVRSYDAKRLYHHPENGVAHGDGYERAIVVRTPERPGVPIFVLRSPRRVSVYALLHDREFVADPIRFQLRNALVSLFRPESLMTLFFVRDKSADAGDRDVSAAEDLLLAAIDSFAAQTGASPQ